MHIESIVRTPKHFAKRPGGLQASPVRRWGTTRGRVPSTRSVALGGRAPRAKPLKPRASRRRWIFEVNKTMNPEIDERSTQKGRCSNISIPNMFTIGISSMQNAHSWCGGAFPLRSRKTYESRNWRTVHVKWQFFRNGHSEYVHNWRQFHAKRSFLEQRNIFAKIV